MRSELEDVTGANRGEKYNTHPPPVVFPEHALEPANRVDFSGEESVNGEDMNTYTPAYPATAPRATAPAPGLFGGLEQAFVPKRAVSYLRVSTKAQAKRGGREEGFSIPAQREANRKKAESLGAMIVKEFIDPGETGTTLRRKGLQEMLAYLGETPDIDFVIVHKLDRLARSRAGDVEIVKALDEAGTVLISTTENIDQTPTGMLMHGILASINQFYSNNLATEVMKGMTQKAKTGGTPGLAPLGYLNRLTIDEMGREIRDVIVDPINGPLMRRAFDLYATGEWTIIGLVEHLNALGLRTRATPTRPSVPVTKNTLNRLLTMAYYRGVVTYQGVEYPGVHEPLVDPDTWYKVQTVLAGHRNGERTRKHPHFLKSTLVCGRCGSRMLVHNAKSKTGDIYPYFVCIGRREKKTVCGMRAVLIHVVEDKVANLYRTISLSAGERDRIEQAVLAELAASSQDSLERRQALAGQKTKLLHEQQRLLQAHYADAIPLELLKAEQDRIARTLVQIDKEQAALAGDIAEARLNLEKMLDLLEGCEDIYRSLPEHLRRLMNQAFFDRVLVDLDDDQQTPKLTADLAEPLGMLMSQFRAIGATSGEPAPEHETSPVPKDEARLALHAVRRRNRHACGAGLRTNYLEGLTGIEPALSAWEAEVLPLNYSPASNQPRNSAAGATMPLYRLDGRGPNAAETPRFQSARTSNASSTSV